MSEESARRYLKDIIRLLEKIPHDKIERVVNLLFEVYNKGNEVIVFGNGGSAATASNLVCNQGRK